MKLLIRALFIAKKHVFFLVISLCSLFMLSIADQLEMFSLGLMTSIDTGPAEAGSGEQASSNLLKGVNNANPLKDILGTIKAKLAFTSSVKAMVTLLVFVALFKAVWLFASRYFVQVISVKISKDLRQNYFEHIQALPMSFYQKYEIGTLSSRVVSDAVQISSSINSCMINFLQMPFVLLTTLAGCFYISWQLSLIIFCGVPLVVFPIVFLARRVKQITKQLQLNQEKFASVLIDFLAGIQTVKVFAMELFSLKKYKEQNDRMAELEAKTAKYSVLARPILHTITTLCLAVVVIFGLYTLKLSLSQLLVFCGLLRLVYEPVKKFAEENSNIQKGIVAAERMFQVLSLESEIKDVEGAIELQEFNQDVEFKDVWFKYNREWVLRGVSFKVKKGQTVAIVGPTGSGKSTIVQLLPRLYDVQRGEILIDGKNLKAYTQKSIREIVSIVTQKPFFFIDTIFSNIAYGRDFSLEQVQDAAKKAYADEFVNQLSEKYETRVAETGKNFSGGQQQRLAIARALVKNAPILVLDEATSSLDGLSENRIKSAIASLHGKVTQIIIAHRLSTIEHADVIIYLERGRKIAEGTREELIQSCPAFRQNWDAMCNIASASSTALQPK